MLKIVLYHNESHGINLKLMGLLIYIIVFLFVCIDEPVYLYEPSRRWGPIVSASAEELYFYGGFVENFKKLKTQLKNSVQVYNSFIEAWKEIHTTGTPPTGLYNGAASYSEQCLFTYGGTDGTSCSASLHKLDTRSCTWTQLSSQHENGPMSKIGGNMIHYNNSIVISGGYGTPSGELQAGSQFMEDKNGDGCTNEIHMFNISEGI